jgi:hypothetical protein
MVIVAIAATACTTLRQAQGRPSTAPAQLPSPTYQVTSSLHVMVMPPLVAATAAPGNVGRDLPAIEADVTTRILSIVRERIPGAAVADRRSASPPAPRLPGYDAAAGEVVTVDEMNAAIDARTRGATHLLVPTITEWKQMRAGDPVGALIIPHNSVTIRLRLMRVDPPAIARQATFHNNAHVTLNQKANRLLDERFRRTVLQLIGG